VGQAGEALELGPWGLDGVVGWLREVRKGDGEPEGGFLEVLRDGGERGCLLHFR
jgi:hypothetical protein